MKRALFALLLTGCIDTSIEATTVSLSVAGTDAPAFEDRAGHPVTLTRADLAFGPLYLCPGNQAGELCEEALAEHTDAVVVDALDPDPVSVGEMPAITGTARSFMYDLGIASLLGRDAPLVTEAARSLGDVSTVVEGQVEVAGQTVPFEIAVPIAAGPMTEGGVPVVRSGTADAFVLEILPDGGSSLTVRFDPRAWLRSADFGSLVEDEACAPGLPVACAGAVEQTCSGDGSVAATRDCAALGEVCLAGVGCAERAILDASTQPGRALVNGVSAGTRPAFESRP